MKRLIENLHIDLVAAALMIGMIATGYILRFPLPPGSNKSLSLWGLTRHQWGAIHFWISLGLLISIAIHVYLHWQWIVVSVKRRFWGTTPSNTSPFFSGFITVLLLLAVLVLFGWVTQSSVKPIADSTEGICPPENVGDQTGPITSADSAPASNQQVAFWSDVYPIFEKSCLHCHGPSKQISGFRVDHREDFFEGTTPLVVPGSSKDSPLIVVLSGVRKDMARADVHRLAKEQLTIVRAWIDVGAEWPDRPLN